MQINASTVLVTGGASGLGEGTVRLLVAGGAKVMIADVQVEKGEGLAKALGCHFVKTDVTSEADGQAAVAATVAAFGGITGLVNCAGIGGAERTIGKSGPHSLASFSRTVTVNLIGSFNMIRLAATAMAKGTPNSASERGVIVNTASVAAYDGQIGQAAYSASKGGIVGMTLPIARDLARDGIRVVTIAPGIFATPMLSSLPQEVQHSLAQSVPFPQRLGTPADYAALVRHIFEQEMLNGETIRLDGAIRMAPR
jgi:NAD(P)-dependent dehydrogenase (short-subunit alcohol dehydrogenase family)